MPIAPHFHLEHMRDLAMQMKCAPEKIRHKQLKAVEEVLIEIDGNTLYPLDYIVFRITKHRTDNLEQPMLFGHALLGDLVSLVAIVSWTLRLPSHGMKTVQEAAEYLKVSSRTISRLRKEGLVFYWVVEKDGKKRLGCAKEMLSQFQDRNSKRLELASKFSRLTGSEKQQIVSAAMQYNGNGRTLNSIASELAKKSGRGHETVRSLLQSIELPSQSLNSRKPLTKQDIKIIERARRLGITWEALSVRFTKSVGALQKALARLRATRLKQLDISYVELDVFQREGADEVILSPIVVKKLLPPVLSINPLHFGFASEMQVQSDETAMVSAMHLLRRRAKLRIQQLTYSPNEHVLDRIETDLRWSYLLQQQLILFAIQPCIAIAVQHIGRPLHELPPLEVITTIKEVISIASDACGSLDPSKGQSTTRTPAATLDRTLSKSNALKVQDRAATLLQIPSILLPFKHIVSWNYLIPDKEQTKISAMHLGWRGYPKTIDEISIELGRSKNWVSRQIK